MLEVKNIEKHFRGVHALRNVSITFRAGEIHGLLGENGAGKSTLMKIVSGVYKLDSGSIYLEGQPITIDDPMVAYSAGVRIVHQELSLIPSLSVAENMFIHRFREQRALKLVDRKACGREARATLREWGITVDPGEKVSNVSMGVRQLVEIARELSSGGKVIILDEPTSSLTFREIDRLFDVLRKLKQEGYVLIFISHRMNEVLALVDRVTVLRDGEVVESAEKSALTPQGIVSLIAGKKMVDIGGLFPKTEVPIGDTALEVRGLSSEGFRDVSLRVRWGEILGIAGLVGAGRSEVLRTIFGLQPAQKGQVLFEGQPIDLGDPQSAIRRHLVMLSESRSVEGIFPDMSVSDNLIILKAWTIVKNGLLNKKKIRAKTDRAVGSLNVVTTNAYKQTVAELSGGNQQKVVVARLLGAEPKILLLDEPTRGVDVGNKTEIHRYIGRFLQEGGAAIMVSSELDELVSVCDRMVILHEGDLVGEFAREEFDRQRILACMMQVKDA